MNFLGEKQTKDYRMMFDHKWMEKLSKALSDRGISNIVIVMDIAKYYSNLSESTSMVEEGSNLGNMLRTRDFVRN